MNKKRNSVDPKDLMGKFVVIRFYQGNSDNGFLSLVKFDNHSEGKFHWDAGQSVSWCILLDSTEIVEILDDLPTDYDEIFKLQLWFYKTYFPLEPEEYRQSNGWLSPTGDFYSCEYGGHDGLAEKLSAIWYDDFLNYREMIERGWMMIYGDGTCNYSGKYILSQKMKDAIKKMSVVGGEKWNKRMEYILKEYGE